MKEILAENTVNERIGELVDLLSQGNKSAFAKTVGISNQSLGEIVGKRQSTPSFAALQKIFVAFPQVRMQWLILGLGQMLQKEKPKREEYGRSRKQKVFTSILTKQLEDQPDEPEFRLPELGYVSIQRALDNHKMLESVYAVAVKSTETQEWPLLSKRLAVSEKEAERLVVKGEIKSKYISEEEGYRVTEQWVLDFMAGPDTE